MYVDTHCHLNMMVKKDFDVLMTEEQLYAVGDIVHQAMDAKVERILNVGTSLVESKNSVNIAARYDAVHAAVGIHPCDVKNTWKQELEELEVLLRKKSENKIVAIGETGLDFYHKPYDAALQEVAFEAHIALAMKYDLPLIVHVRDSGNATLNVLQKYVGKIRGVNHCFSQDEAFAKKLGEWGFYFGIDAPITYPKNEAFRRAVATIPLERIILETDAPFLPPQHMRGKQNSPAYIPLFAPTLAQVKGVELFDLAAMTTTNAKKLFGF